MLKNYPDSALQLPDPPAALLTAVKVMYAGAVFAVIQAVVFATTVSATKSVIKAKHPHMSASALTTTTHAGVIFEVVGAVISAVLFVWIARSCRAGKNRARITGTALFGVAVLITAYSLGPGAETTLQLILTVLGALIGLAAVVLLWQRSCSAWFTLFNRPQF
jgi:hypothetical protein